MKQWFDVETQEIVTEFQLLEEFRHFQRVLPDEYNYSFAEYIKNCESKNGTLIRIIETDKK